MKISFVGAGRVATHLAKIFAVNGIKIHQICSRDITHASKLAVAVAVNANPINQLQDLELVDVLFIAVNDAEIANVTKQLALQHYTSLVVHTSGSTSLDILINEGLRAGVFYPLQTFSFDREVNWDNTPLFLESEQPQDLEILKNIANLLSKSIYCYSSAQRLSLHLAAVFACNFSNYCYDIAQQILIDKQVETSLLLPLILETAQKLQNNLALQNQTGPACRGDNNILAMHHDMLKEHPEWQQIYDLMSMSIQQRHKS